MTDPDRVTESTGRVRVHDLSVTLDGFGTGGEQSLEASVGHAGGRLPEWALAAACDGAAGLEVRIGDGPSTARGFLEAHLIDHMFTRR